MSGNHKHCCCQHQCAVRDLPRLARDIHGAAAQHTAVQLAATQNTCFVDLSCGFEFLNSLAWLQNLWGMRYAFGLRSLRLGSFWISVHKCLDHFRSQAAEENHAM